MPCFSTNKINDHARLVTVTTPTKYSCHQWYTVKYWPDKWPLLLLMGNHAWIRLKSVVATAIIQIIKIAWITYLGALSCLNVILIPQISAHVQSWPFVRCTAHGPLFARVQYKHKNKYVWCYTHGIMWLIIHSKLTYQEKIYLPSCMSTV